MFHYFILCVCCIYTRFFSLLTWLHTFSYLVLYSGVIPYILSSSLFYYSSATKTTCYHSQLLLYFHYFFGGVCEPRLGSVPLWKNGFPWSPAQRLFNKKAPILTPHDESPVASGSLTARDFRAFHARVGGWFWLEIISGFRIWQWGYNEKMLSSKLWTGESRKRNELYLGNMKD